MLGDFSGLAALVKDERRHVMIIQREIRQYRIPFLEALREELAERRIDLSLVHNNPPRSVDERQDVLDWSRGRRGRSRVIGTANRSLLWQSAPEGLWDTDMVIVEQASRLILNYRLLMRRHRGGPLVAFWGHGASAYPDASRLGEGVKRYISTQPDWWFAYTDGVAERVHELGFPRERITSVRNATDTRRMAALMAGVSDEQQTRLRHEFGVTGHTIGLFVGAIVQEKHLDFLVASADEIRAEIPDFELVVTGHGPLASWLTEQARLRPWLHVVGQSFDEELAGWLSLASVLLVPSWVGLVIVDGFAAGRPVFASRSAAHPPEIEYLRHRENGLFIDDRGVPRRYAEEVVAALRDRRFLSELQSACREDATRFSAEDMAQRFAQGIFEALAMGRRGHRR